MRGARRDTTRRGIPTPSVRLPELPAEQDGGEEEHEEEEGEEEKTTRKEKEKKNKPCRWIISVGPTGGTRPATTNRFASLQQHSSTLSLGPTPSAETRPAPQQQQQQQQQQPSFVVFLFFWLLRVSFFQLQRLDNCFLAALLGPVSQPTTIDGNPFLSYLQPQLLKELRFFSFNSSSLSSFFCFFETRGPIVWPTEKNGRARPSLVD